MELDPILNDIVVAVRERLSPRRIILFGSRVRGEAGPDSDYDILVETAQRYTFEEGWHALDGVRRARRVAIDVHLRAPGELERREPDPGWIDRAIVAEGVLLYCDASVDTGGLPARRVREARSGEWESAADWLAAAEIDMRIVEMILAHQEPAWGGIAYHAQQAAEKSLKAALVMRDRVPPRTRNLDELLADLIGTGLRLDQLDQLASDCEALAPYAVQGRYPGTGPIPNEVKARQLVESARRIVAAVRSVRRSRP
jgi:HEPN domain-containing protein/predicted nucleotidyltransferase